jgi:hypothetical protein
LCEKEEYWCDGELNSGEDLKKPADPSLGHKYDGKAYGSKHSEINLWVYESSSAIASIGGDHVLMPIVGLPWSKWHPLR